MVYMFQRHGIAAQMLYSLILSLALHSSKRRVNE
jgi:hypothetical protein